MPSRDFFYEKTISKQLFAKIEQMCYNVPVRFHFKAGTLTMKKKYLQSNRQIAPSKNSANSANGANRLLGARQAGFNPRKEDHL